MNGLNLSNAALHAEHSHLKNNLADNQNECQMVKDALQTLVSKALSSAAVPRNDGSSSVEESDAQSIKFDILSNYSNEIKSTKSVESIQEIVVTSDDEDYHEPMNSDEANLESEIEKKIPGMKKLMGLISQGEVVISSEILNEMKELNIKMNAISKVSGELQERWAALDSKLVEHERELNDIKQYIKSDNLLLHKFFIPSGNLSSLQFCYQIAQQINYFLPQLSYPISWEHISDAHILRTKLKKSNVIIVRFCNRNMQHKIFLFKKTFSTKWHVHNRTPH